MYLFTYIQLRLQPSYGPFEALDSQTRWPVDRPGPCGENT